MPDTPRIHGRILGLNHVTLAVSDLERSLAFYCDVLGCEVHRVWDEGVYLEAGALWLCLSRDPAARTAPHADYTHLAFNVAPEDFAALDARVRAECVIWKENKSEGASTYFLDPDGHKLELHVGTLASRLAAYD